jgi:hypothetical protein
MRVGGRKAEKTMQSTTKVCVCFVPFGCRAQNTVSFGVYWVCPWKTHGNEGYRGIFRIDIYVHFFNKCVNWDLEIYL